MIESTWKRIAVATLGTWLVLPALWAGAQSLGQPGRPSLVLTDEAESGVRKDPAAAHREVSANASPKDAKVDTQRAVAAPPAPAVSAAKRAQNQIEGQRGK